MSASHQIVCGHCGKINRLPAERTATNARCGSCHQPIFSGQPIEVDEEAFGRSMAPMFERAANELEPKVRLLKLNADIAPSISSRLGISGIPTLLLMQGGREISRTSGAMDTSKIVAWTMAGLARS